MGNLGLLAAGFVKGAANAQVSLYSNQIEKEEKAADAIREENMLRLQQKLSDESYDKRSKSDQEIKDKEQSFFGDAITDKDGNTTKEVFNSKGEIIAIIDANDPNAMSTYQKRKLEIDQSTLDAKSVGLARDKQADIYNAAQTQFEKISKNLNDLVAKKNELIVKNQGLEGGADIVALNNRIRAVKSELKTAELYRNKVKPQFLIEQDSKIKALKEKEIKRVASLEPAKAIKELDKLSEEQQLVVKKAMTKKQKADMTSLLTALKISDSSELDNDTVEAKQGLITKDYRDDSIALKGLLQTKDGKTAQRYIDRYFADIKKKDRSVRLQEFNKWKQKVRDVPQEVLITMGKILDIKG